MKKTSLILVIAFALGMMLTSCNKKTCPAYSHNDQEQSENYDG
jgi:hypothetical protein